MAWNQWPGRHAVFKTGVFGAVLSMLLFLTGFSAPAWYGDMGLWMTCGVSSCIDHPGAWLYVVRTLQCLALIAFLLCLAAEGYQDFYKTPIMRDSRIVESLAVLAGVLSLVGSSIFGIMTSHSERSSYKTHHNDTNLSWGYALVIASSILILISSAAIAYGRRLHHRHTLAKVATLQIDNQLPIGMYEYTDVIPNSSMTLIPLGHGAHMPSVLWARPPPRYILPPPYPYPHNYASLFLPPFITTTPYSASASGPPSFTSDDATHRGLQVPHHDNKISGTRSNDTVDVAVNVKLDNSSIRSNDGVVVP